MKYIDIDNLEQLPGRRLEAGDTFLFRCHPKIACFNQCCRNLNLFLYPYDVIRLKKRLNITSNEFLDNHVDIVLRASNFYPEVLLKMSDNTERTCPFLSNAGCMVYPDRPDTCRTFPLEQGVLYDAAGNSTTLVHFFRPPDFCKGQHENSVWTTRSWAQDQQAVIYNQMTLQWSELKRRFQDDPWGQEGPVGPKAKMVFMATYNLDQFRDFVLNSTFLRRYKVKSATLNKIRSEDVELMQFGFEWVEFFIWGIKPRSFKLR
ncbi:MAG: YkgJ family cysteine cluster protein [Pseudomonadota bacterium]